MGELRIETPLVVACTQFKKKYGEPQTIIFPCCGHNASPSEVFSNVVYYDKNAEVVAAIEARGHTAYCGDILSMPPIRLQDLLIMISPGLHAMDIVSRFPSTYVICDDSDKTARQLYEAIMREDRKRFRLITQLDTDSSGLETRAELFLTNGIYLFQDTLCPNRAKYRKL